MELLGIDVSTHQKKINWSQVAKTDISFAIIRAGYGKNNVDKYFIENICGASTAGLDIGIYWFIYALNEQDAIENANKCHETICLYKDEIKLKVWADWEYDSDEYSIKKGVVQNKSSRTRIVRTFLNRLRCLGYDVGVYANPDYLETKFEDLSEYPLWLAKYSGNRGGYCPFMWQYTSEGAIKGIDGDVDMNIGYFSIEEEPTYYPVPYFTLIESLMKIKVDSSYTHRQEIARLNGIVDYKGTAEQNNRLLELLKAGKLRKS